MAPLEVDGFTIALGKQMRAEISAAGLSDRAVAIKAGMQPVVLGRYLRGERDIPSSVLARVLNAIEQLGGPAARPHVIVRRAEERMSDTSADLDDFPALIPGPDGIARSPWPVEPAPRGPREPASRKIGQPRSESHD